MRYNTFVLTALLFAGTMILISGCAQPTKHELLSFFFTGVPSPEEEREGEQRTLQARTAMNQKAEGRSLFSSHSYFTSKKCGECHQVSSTQSFGRSARSGMPTISFGTGGGAGEKRLPVKKVCVSCHENRSAAYASANSLWLHAPATKYNCIVCHDPHQSSYPDLLKDDTDKLCIMCHSKGLIGLTKEHRELKDCLKCHNPHLGQNKFLLVKDYKEIRRLPTPSADSFDG